MGEVVSMYDYKNQKVIDAISDLVESTRNEIEELYETIVPFGFKTRRRKPIAEMNLSQLNTFFDEMQAWIHKNLPKLEGVS